MLGTRPDLTCMRAQAVPNCSAVAARGGGGPTMFQRHLNAPTPMDPRTPRGASSARSLARVLRFGLRPARPRRWWLQPRRSPSDTTPGRGGRGRPRHGTRRSTLVVAPMNSATAPRIGNTHVGCGSRSRHQWPRRLHKLQRHQRHHGPRGDLTSRWAAKLEWAAATLWSAEAPSTAATS